MKAAEILNEMRDLMNIVDEADQSFRGGTYEFVYDNDGTDRIPFDSPGDAMDYGTKVGAISMVKVTADGKPMGKPFEIR